MKPNSTEHAEFRPGRMSKPSGGFIARLLGEQRRMATPIYAKGVVADLLDALRSAGRGPARTETFEQAVQRLGLSEYDLAVRLEQLKKAQLIVYGFAALLTLYGLHLFVSQGALTAIAVWVAAAAMFVRGYLFAFRAWQIENRNLVALRQAVFNPKTYLVL